MATVTLTRSKVKEMFWVLASLDQPNSSHCIITIKFYRFRLNSYRSPNNWRSLYFIGGPQKIARLNLSFAIHLLLVCVGQRTLCTHARTLLLPRRRCKRVPASTITSSGIAGTEMKEASSPIPSLSRLSVVLRSAISNPSHASLARTKIVNVPLSM
jgi:hypothetical protein